MIQNTLSALDVNTSSWDKQFLFISKYIYNKDGELNSGVQVFP